MKKWETTLAVAMLALGFGYFATSLWTVHRSYSPVPYWDEWGGVVQFYENVETGNWSAWWAPHTDHRLVYPRLYFWAVSEFFHGSEAVLLCASLVHHGLTIALFAVVIMATGWSPARKTAAFGIVLALLCAWVQHENLRRPFQLQFFAVYAFPFLSILLFERAITKSSDAALGGAVGAALLATASMANGILVFPVLLLTGAIGGLNRKRLAAIAAVFMITATAYFAYRILDARDPSGFDLFAWIAYTLRYLGAPFAHLISGSAFEAMFELLDELQWKLGSPIVVTVERGAVAVAMGMLFIGVTAVSFTHAYRHDQFNGVSRVLLSLIAFVIATAAVTALGRLDQGSNTAFASRYATPTLIGWAALFVICLQQVRTRSLLPGFVWAFFVVFAIGLGNRQADALRHDYRQALFERNVGALALKLGARDTEFFRRLHPNPDRLAEFAAFAIARNLNVFQEDWLRAVGNVEIDEEQTGNSIDGAIGTTTGIGDSQLERIEGWVASAPGDPAPNLLCFIDEEHDFIGYAVDGKPRAEEPISTIGWTGYIRRDATVAGVYRVDTAGELTSVRINWPAP